MSRPPPTMPPRPEPRTSSAGARTMLASAPPSAPPHKEQPTVWGEPSFAPSPIAGEYAVLGDNDDDVQDDVDLEEHKANASSGGTSAAASTGAVKPSLSAFKQKFKSKASEAAKATAEWRARAAEKGTELSAKAKGAVADWESKAKERNNATRNGSPNGSGPVGGDSAATSNAVFGVSIAEALERSKIGKVSATCGYPEHVVRALPAVFFRSVEALNINGLDEVGIYRISGSTSEVANIRSMFSSGQDVELVGKQIDCNAIASLFKAWLRELPESILTEQVATKLSRLYQTSANDSVDPTTDSKLLADTRAIFADASLPFSIRCMLYVLFGHLSLVASKESVNKMSVGNLQVIFCPTLGIGSQLFKVLVAEYEPLFGGVRTESPPPPAKVGSRYSDGRLATTPGSGALAPGPPQKPVRSRPSSTSASTALSSGSGSGMATLQGQMRPASASESPTVLSYSKAPPTAPIWESVNTVPVATSRGAPPPTMRVSWGSAKDNISGTSEPSATSPIIASQVSPFSPVESDAEGTSVLGNLMDDMDPFADVVSYPAAEAPVLVPTKLHSGGNGGGEVLGGGGGSSATPVVPPRHHAPAFGGGNSGAGGAGPGMIWTPPRIGSLEYAQPGRSPPQPLQTQQQIVQQQFPQQYSHHQQQQQQQQEQHQSSLPRQPLDPQPPARFDSWKPSDTAP
ncbi:hypothetical protein HDU86_004616 [Geranomyces michiganensis]|nr:hypothetical protein HDU86_004616 [Geranomyces michiganensis]